MLIEFNTKYGKESVVLAHIVSVFSGEHDRVIMTIRGDIRTQEKYDSVITRIKLAFQGIYSEPS